jgi:hypothetical protein
MTKTELIRAAGEAAPDLMQKTAAVMADLEATHPVFAKDMAKELDEVAGYIVEKVASAGPVGYSPVARWAAGVGSAVAGGLLIGAANDLYDTAKRGLTKKRNLTNIMKVNPDLKQFDKVRLQQSYDALHRFAPEFTADPMVGGTLLKAVAELPGNEHTILKDLISSRKTLLEAKDKQFRPSTVTIDLPSSFDVAMDAKRQADAVSMAAENRNHAVSMETAKSDSMRRLKEQESRERADSSKTDFTRKLRLEKSKATFNAMAQAKYNPKR